MCVSEITLCIGNKTYFDGRMNNCYVLRLSSIFIFFSDRRTLKLLKMKCNPTNKKTCGPRHNSECKNHSRTKSFEQTIPYSYPYIQCVVFNEV